MGCRSEHETGYFIEAAQATQTDFNYGAIQQTDYIKLQVGVCVLSYK